MTDDAIPLSRVPEVFFDQGTWSEFIALQADRSVAVAALDEEVPSFVTYARKQLAAWGSPESERVQRSLEAARLGDALVVAMLNSLRSGALSATALQPPSIERRPIPAELWHDLRPKFATNTAASEHYLFTSVMVAVPSSSATPDLIDECEAWLGVQPKALKKVLRAAALQRFGKTLTYRQFDVAYTRTYRRPRGRPRNEAK